MRKIILALLGALWCGVATAQVPTGPYGPGTAPPPRVTLEFTTGPDTLTGTTSQTIMAALPIPAGAMGLNGEVKADCLWSRPGSQTGTATLNYELATSPAGAGAQALLVNWVMNNTTESAWQPVAASNINSASAQESYPQPIYGSGTAAPISTTVNTANLTYFLVVAALATATDTVVLQHCTITIYGSTP